MKGEALTILWRRLDLPGHEACRITSVPAGWQLSGTAVFAYEGQACRQDYVIQCDPHWQTLSATVEGWVGDREVSVEIVREASGEWRLNGRECPEVAGCTDVDLNFSPSTNLLPIRRLALEVGQSAPVRAAWLRFPSFALEPLEQSYARLEENLYRYESAGGRFVAQVTVDEEGLVTRYGDFWVRASGD
jgi:uncharacterized protein